MMPARVDITIFGALIGLGMFRCFEVNNCIGTVAEIKPKSL